MYHIMYISTATVQLQDETLHEMLTKYRRNNLRDGITGLLLYSGDHFVQLIEGDQSAVEELFQKIVKDPFHRNIIKLADGPITARLFADWEMGFKALNKEEASQLRGYVDPSHLNFLNSVEKKDEETAISVLQQFIQQNLSTITY